MDDRGACAGGIITERDYLAAQWLHMRFKPLLWILCIPMAALILWPWPQVHTSLAVETRSDALFRAAVMLVGAVFAYLPVHYFLFIPWQAKRTYRQHKSLREPLTIAVVNDGLEFRQERGNAVVPWSHIHKYRHNKTLILLYRTNSMFHMVPSHFFKSTDEFTTFLSSIREHLGNAT